MAKHASVGGQVGAGIGPAAGGDGSRRPLVAGGKHAVPPRSGIRRIVGLAVLVGLAATAFLVVSRLNPAHSDQAPPEAPSTAADAGEPLPTGSPGTPATQQPATSVRSVPSTAADSTPATLQGPPPAVLPQTGPGLTRPGILLIASPASDGSFDVIERIRMASPVSVLTLRPAPVDQAGREFASASAAATQVQVSAGDQPVVVPGARVDATIDLSVAAVDEFELRYRLTDVTVRSTPSTAGRALAAIGPLTGSVDNDLPVLFIVSGGTVLGLNCPLLPFSQQSCGSHVQSPPSVQHELPWRLALTSVQFNLPPM